MPENTGDQASRLEIGDGVVPFCACARSGRSPQALEKIWRPRRDLNPCYRRESRPRVRNRLKLNGTDSALGHLSDCGDGLSDC